MPGERFERFAGGSPGAIIFKLVVLSLLVGFLMAYFELTPWGLFEWAQSQIARFWRQGWRALTDVGGWLLMGAIIVVPVWLILRLFARRR